MSGVKRYNMDVDKFGHVRAYESEHGRWVKRGGYAALEAERDALRAQIEAMRELLRKVAQHFAAPPGLGHLHAEIDAALQAKP